MIKTMQELAQIAIESKGQWIDTGKTNGAYKSYIQDGRSKGVDKGRFNAAMRKGRVYMRYPREYNPYMPPENQEMDAFFENMGKFGPLRTNALDKIGRWNKYLWEFNLENYTMRCVGLNLDYAKEVVEIESKSKFYATRTQKYRTKLRNHGIKSPTADAIGIYIAQYRTEWVDTALFSDKRIDYMRSPKIVAQKPFYCIDDILYLSVAPAVNLNDDIGKHNIDEMAEYAQWSRDKEWHPLRTKAVLAEGVWAGCDWEFDDILWRMRKK